MGFTFSDWGIVRYPKTFGTGNGKQNISFQLSKASSRKNKQGEYEPVYDNIQCVRFDAHENLINRLVDRARVYVRGDMKQESYVKDNVTHYIMKVYIDKLEFTDGSASNGPGEGSANTGFAEVGDMPF